MAKSNANNPQLIAVTIGTLSTTGTYPVCNLPKNFILIGAKLLDQAGIAADNTNYVTLTLKQGATAIAKLDTRAANEGAVTANTGKAFTVDPAVVTGLVTNGVAYEVPAGDVTLAYAEGGTGTLTLAVVQLMGYWK